MRSQNKPEKTDIQSLIAALNHLYPLGTEVEEFIKSHCFGKKMPKYRLLLKSGQVCEYIYFIRQGAIRGFVKEGGKDITTWISIENEIVTSISGLDSDKPSLENMQTIENCDLIMMSTQHLQQLYKKFPEFNIHVRKLLQKYYADAEGRALVARLSNAETKYNYFLERYAHLANRIPLKYVASFLGMTQETVSRTRKKLLPQK